MGRLLHDLAAFFPLRRTLAACSIWLLLAAAAFLEAEEGAGSSLLVRQVMGGVTPRGALDIMAVFRWAACICPGILLSLSYLDEARGDRLFLVLPRIGRRRWWGHTLLVLLAGNGLYALSGLGLLLITAPLFGHPIDADFGFYLAVWVLLALCLTATALIAGMLAACVSPAAGQAFWVALHSLSALLGCKGAIPLWIPSGCYGMIEQVGASSPQIWIIAGVQAVIVVAVWAFGYRHITRV